jgi:hypothetical protein
VFGFRDLFERSWLAGVKSSQVKRLGFVTFLGDRGLPEEEVCAPRTSSLPGMGMDGMVWYGMVWDGMIWDGIGWDGMGWDRMG